jgi:hypothetical protein
MYVPSQAKVSSGSLSDCQVQINSQLLNGTFPTMENGGTSIYICGSVPFNNAVSVDPDKDIPVNKAIDEDTTDNDNIAWIVLGCLMGVVLLLFVVVCLPRSNNKSLSVRKKKMQEFLS